MLDELFRALADPTRRQILSLLKRRDLSAGEIAEHFPLAKSTLSGHFNVLKHAGLILAERRGTTIVYSLNLSAFEEGLGAVIELFGAGGGRKERGGR
jgi:DNA-binding transcriptional ArsR family regulator